MVAPLFNAVRSIGGWVVNDQSTRAVNADSANQPFRSFADRYRECESFYDNVMYDAIGYGVGAMKARRGLYRNIRPIRNPMRRAIDWYPGKLYPGAMTADGNALPDGTPSCLPFAPDTDDALKLAVAQAFAWGNFGALRWEFGRGLPMLGDQFGEVTVDWARGKVYPCLTHPGFVVDAEWNGSGDLIMYHLEIPQYDADARKAYRWGKRVDRETIATFYDGKPYGYDGDPAVMANPWGFVPAAWCQFRNVGGQHGAALSDGVRGKIDELNNILAPIHDYIGKFVNQGVVISAQGGRKSFEEANGNRSADIATAQRTNPEGGRQELNYLFAPANATFQKLIENLGLGESDSHVNRMIAEIEADLPEATIDDKIRQDPRIAGVALRMMFGDVETRLAEAAGNADGFWVKLAQMCCSIGGQLANSGAWGLRSQLTEAQQRFLPFDLGSYDDGALDITFLPRAIFPDSPDERIARALQVEQLQTRVGAEMAGLSDEQITALLGEVQAKQAALQPATGAQTPDEAAATAFLDRHLSPAMRGAMNGAPSGGMKPGEMTGQMAKGAA